MENAALIDLPEIEILDGVEHPKVSPRRTHALVQLRLGHVLSECAADRGEVGSEWRFDLGAVDASESQFVPDLAFISYESMRAMSDEQAEKPPRAPDVAIDIRSPSTDLAFLRRKIARYLRCGALLVLDVDPAAKCINAHDENGAITYAEDETFAHQAVPWLRFEVEAIFPKPRPR